MNLQDYNSNREQIASLLAADNVRIVIEQAKDDEKLAPNSDKNTLIIGIGGTGVTILDQVKRTISERLNGTWPQHIRFLGIDTSDEVFKGKTLDDTEQFLLSDTGINAGLTANNPQMFSTAWHRFVDLDMARSVKPLTGKGSAAKRLVSKMKLYHKPGYSQDGNDERLVKKLKKIRGENWKRFDIYVIASCYGGTGSGIFAEIPALLWEAFGKNTEDTKIYGMLFLPDNVNDGTTETDNQMKNGYATLKELNYFEGLTMRNGYIECWPYNGSARLIKSDMNMDYFYRVPYLIGTKNGYNENANSFAKQSVAEFFISILGDMQSQVNGGMYVTDEFENNANGKRGTLKDAAAGYSDAVQIENENSAYDFPKHFASFGIAKAAAPAEIYKAYVLSSICAKAKLQPAKGENDAVLRAQADDASIFLPFAAENATKSIDDGNREALNLLQPLLEVMEELLDWKVGKKVGEKALIDSRGNQKKYEWDDLANHSSGISNRVNQYIEEMKSDSAKDAYKKRMSDAFTDYRQRVKTYVKKYGPFAFYNLYQGTFAEGGNGQVLGIKRRLEYLGNKMTADGGSPVGVQIIPDADSAQQECSKWKATAQKKYGGWFKAPGDWFTNTRRNAVNKWERLHKEWAAAAILKERKTWAYGDQGVLDTCFIKPAEELAKSILTFGRIVSIMCEKYEQKSRQFENFIEFANVRQDELTTNIAGLDIHAHQELKKRASDAIATVDGQAARDALVDSFFKDMKSWITVPEDLVVKTDAGGVSRYSLVDETKPASARILFDNALLKEMAAGWTNISIAEMFAAAGADQVDRYADLIAEELFQNSGVLLNVHPNHPIPKDNYFRYVVYPKNLDASIKDALQKAISSKNEDNPNLGFYASVYTDTITMFQMAAPFEVYTIRELEKWEREYENCQSVMQTGLHGYGPDVEPDKAASGLITYKEAEPWTNYPGITYHKDPKNEFKPGSTDIVHEGTTRVKIDASIDTARNEGVLFAENCGTEDAEKWEVHFCRLPKRKDDWVLDFSKINRNEHGMKPEGKELLPYIAAQNNTTEDVLKVRVSLGESGILSEPQATESAAWEFASRILYAHRPMLHEIQMSTEKYFKKWNEEARKENEQAEQRMRAAKAIRIMQAGVYYLDSETNAWNIKTAKTTKEPIAAVDAKTITTLTNSNPQDVVAYNAGFKLEYAYRKLMEHYDQSNVKHQIGELMKKANQEFASGNAPETIHSIVEQLNAEAAILDEMREKYGYKENKDEFFATVRQYHRIKPEGMQRIIDFYDNAQNWDMV